MRTSLLKNITDDLRCPEFIRVVVQIFHTPDPSCDVVHRSQEPTTVQKGWIHRHSFSTQQLSIVSSEQSLNEHRFVIVQPVDPTQFHPDRRCVAFHHERREFRGQPGLVILIPSDQSSTHKQIRQHGRICNIVLDIVWVYFCRYGGQVYPTFLKPCRYRKVAN